MQLLKQITLILLGCIAAAALLAALLLVEIHRAWLWLRKKRPPVGPARTNSMPHDP